MASATFDSEQRKLRQSLTLPASQPETVSLQKKALSAIGKSSDTAICIPSDFESDTEDENDEGRELNSLQSCATRASTPDYLDLTGIEHGATESEAAIGVVTAPTLSPAPAEAAPACPSQMQVCHIADAQPSQKSSCKINHMLTGHTSASHDTSFATPPTSPESQPYLVAADRQELRPVLVSEQSNMIVDAVSDHGACHDARDAQVHPDSPSTCTHSPRTTSPVEVTQASLEASEASVDTSRDDVISEAYTPSPARPSAEPHQAQGLVDASCAPSDAEPEVAEAGFESPYEAQVSSPSLSPRLSRHISLQIHKAMQSKDSYADSEVSESEDGLNGLEFHYQDETSPSLADSEDSDSEDDDADAVHQGRKRRKVSKSASCSVHSTAASSRGSRSSRQRRSTTHAAQLPSAIRMSGRDIDSSTPSQATPVPSEAHMFLARFEE
ncbi:Myb-like domain-containing protein [Fusarium sp. Ph1]|nr:Myb-like domain-containing protein [Fusarium sp. Ph1]